MKAPIAFPWDAPPGTGTAQAIAPGVLWMRLPLPMKLDHVNVYALDDGDGWTVIDTGFDTAESRAIWAGLLDGPLSQKPVTRVVATHHHPDHIGLSGWFMARGASLATTRTAWLTARMLTLDNQAKPSAETLDFWREAGMPPGLLAELQTQRPFNFADVVCPLPVGFLRLQDGGSIHMGGRDWDIRTGDGHAPEHATFWSKSDNLVIGGDQLLPGISPNLGTYPTEPLADPVSEWLTSCARFAGIAQDVHLVLPGHKLPFTGLPTRLIQLQENHLGALDRLEATLRDGPRTAVGCFPVLFRRPITKAEFGLALVEAVAHINHLAFAGRIVRAGVDSHGGHLWRANA